MQTHGDPLEVYARIQAAKEDLTQPLRGFSSVHRLGAPMEADWRRYPISDRVVFTALGLLARGLGIFAALNVAIAAVHVLNAAAFYLCARYLRWRPEWAMAMALLFSFCSYNFRWSVTASFSLTFFVPALILLCGWIAKSAPAISAKRWTWVGVGLGAWLGGANPYLSFFATQLVLGAGGLQLLRRREPARWRVGVVFIGVLAVSFFLHHAAYFFADASGGDRLTLSRNYAGSEIYALKLADLFIPDLDHPVPLMAKAGRAYYAQSALRSEFFVNYVGVAGILGIVLLLWAALRAVAQPSRRKIPDAAVGIAWTLIFSAVGGINSLLALGGFDLFRASSRNSIFILVWALFFLGAWCQRRWRPANPLLRYATPALVVALSLADMLPNLRAKSTLRANAAELARYHDLTTALEAKVGTNAAIFQVPSPGFPEAGTAVKMADYEHLLPYLTSSGLRFSYGALRGTDLSRGLRSLARVPAGMMKEELEATGFSAIWIDRRGIFDDGAQLISGLRQLGVAELPQELVPHVSLFLLKPSSQPRPLDLSNPALFEPWDVVLTIGQPELVIYDGWYDYETDGARSWRWAQDTASTGIVVPTTRLVELSFAAYSLKQGDLVLELNGREVARFRTASGTREEHVVNLDLQAGRHRLVWRFTGPVVRPGWADGRQLGFAVENLTVSDPRPR